jgi:hypothetical protein
MLLCVYLLQKLSHKCPVLYSKLSPRYQYAIQKSIDSKKSKTEIKIVSFPKDSNSKRGKNNNTSNTNFLVNINMFCGRYFCIYSMSRYLAAVLKKITLKIACHLLGDLLSGESIRISLSGENQNIFSDVISFGKETDRVSEIRI